MTRDQLIIFINQKITSNGNRAIKGSELNTIFNELLSQIPTGSANLSNYYTKQQIHEMLENLAGSGSVYKFIEEDINVIGNMISGSEVSCVLSEILNQECERTVIYNGVFVSNSMCTINSNNQLIVNLAPLGIIPKVADFITIKYYKI